MESPVVDELLRRVAAHGLDGTAAAITIDVGEEDWAGFVRLAAAHRLTGLLNAAVRTTALSLDDERSAEVAALHRTMTARVLLLEATLVSVTGLLEAEGVPFRVLKGPAFAALYPDPAWRPYVDVDLLVPGERFADAAPVLDRAGFRRRNAGLGSDFDRRFGKGATFRNDDIGVNVDLHRTLVGGPYGFIVDPADLFADASYVEVAGVALPTLDAEAAFVHSCISTVLSDARPKLMTVRDVAQQVQTGRLNSERIEGLCERWRIAGVVASAVETAETSFAVGLDSYPVRSGERSPVAERLAWWSYTGDDKRWRRQALTAIAFVPGWSNRAAYLRTIIGARGRFGDR